MHSESNQNVSILSHFTHFFKIIFGPLGFGVWGALCISLIPAIVAKETTVAAIILLLLGEHSTNTVSLNMFFSSLLHTIENSFIYLLPNHWFNNELFNTSINGGIAHAIRLKINSQAHGIYSVAKINLAIYSYMCFILLTIPCITTLGAIYKEFNLKTMIQSLLLGIFVPYLFSLFIFQIGNLLIK